MSSRSKVHLGRHHPVAEVAARLCKAHLGAVRASGVGGVACGGCWERAIRDDERAVVLFELPQEVEPDPSYVDVVAVERALRGESVSLTETERAEVRVREQVRREWQAERAVPWYRLSRLRLSGTDWKGRSKSAAADGSVPGQGSAA